MSCICSWTAGSLALKVKGSELLGVTSNSISHTAQHLLLGWCCSILFGNATTVYIVYHVHTVSIIIEHCYPLMLLAQLLSSLKVALLQGWSIKSIVCIQLRAWKLCLLFVGYFMYCVKWMEGQLRLSELYCGCPLHEVPLYVTLSCTYMYFPDEATWAQKANAVSVWEI